MPDVLVHSHVALLPHSFALDSLILACRKQQGPAEVDLEARRQWREGRLARAAARAREQSTYQYAAIAATVGVSSLAVLATYYRIARHLVQEEAFPYMELSSTLLLVMGGMVRALLGGVLGAPHVLWSPTTCA